MPFEQPSLPLLLAQADAAWARGDGQAAVALFDQVLSAAEATGDLDVQVAAALGLARGQQYNLNPGLLPVHLHAAYAATSVPASRARLAAALARCWAYSHEPARAVPFAADSLEIADELGDPELLADALDASLAAHWGPDDLGLRRELARRLADTTAHLREPDARLQSELWGLTVGWEILDLPRMHRSMRGLELLAEHSAKARFFAASRRLPLELLRGHHTAAPRLIEQAAAASAETSIPDAEAVLAAMRGYTAYFTGDPDGCAAVAPTYEEYAVENGVAVVHAEAAIIWLGAGRWDKVAERIGTFSPTVLADLPRDTDWLLTMQCVAEGALALGDRDVVAAVVQLLAAYPGRSVVNTGAAMWHGVTDDTLARGAALLGDEQAAARHRSAALATYERINARWWLDRLRSSPPGGREPGVPPQRGGSPTSRGGPRVLHLRQQPGGLWTVGQEESPFVLPAMRGLTHLHALLSQPHTELPALELAGGGGSVRQGGLDMLDGQARRAYRARLAQLDDLLADSDDPDLRREQDAIAAELGAAAGLGGRARRTGSHDERARVTVRKAIVAALARIAEQDPWLARYLHHTVRTGGQCRYDPDPDQPVSWVLR